MRNTKHRVRYWPFRFLLNIWGRMGGHENQSIPSCIGILHLIPMVFNTNALILPLLNCFFEVEYLNNWIYFAHWSILLYSARRLMGSRLIVSAAFCNRIWLAQLYINSAQNTLVNWIIRLLLSLWCRPKVILLSGGHCLTFPDHQSSLRPTIPFYIPTHSWKKIFSPKIRWQIITSIYISLMY